MTQRHRETHITDTYKHTDNSHRQTNKYKDAQHKNVTQTNLKMADKYIYTYIYIYTFLHTLNHIHSHLNTKMYTHLEAQWRNIGYQDPTHLSLLTKRQIKRSNRWKDRMRDR